MIFCRRVPSATPRAPCCALPAPSLTDSVSPQTGFCQSCPPRLGELRESEAEGCRRACAQPILLQLYLLLRGSSLSDAGLAPRGALQELCAGFLCAFRSAADPRIWRWWTYRRLLGAVRKWISRVEAPPTGPRRARGYLRGELRGSCGGYKLSCKMPPKSGSNLSGGSKKGKSKRKKSSEDDGAGQVRKQLEATNKKLRQQLATAQSELEQQQRQIAATMAGLTGTGRGGVRKRSADGTSSSGDESGSGEARDGGHASKRQRIELESIPARRKRLKKELETAGNHKGRSRNYEENRTFVFACQ